ncbi:hypothetical protein [Paracoccus marcusii]|uniref:Uncharacterized protein n=1 Tax=Paracoccus marcusii TaxID=59779 RepID=A0ABY7UP13_9RHOB|nr:hypothetical protein [Paracoccus marcusii]WDA11592.1 hypothetical protein PRL19_09785 [Paracoccus marcusii]
MSFTNEDAEAYINKNLSHINRLRRTVIALATTQDILIYSKRLREVSETDASIDAYRRVMDMEAFTTIIVISYGRLFTESKGAPVFKRKLIPEHLLPVHDKIISLRHERYAHHGDHETVAARLGLYVTEHEVKTTIHWNATVHDGVPPQWLELFQWLNNYIKGSFSKQLEYLNTTGKRWENFDPVLAPR